MAKDLLIFRRSLPSALYEISLPSTELESSLIPVDQVDQTSQQLSSSINSIKFYLPMLSCVKLILPENQEELFDSIIAISQNCLASTITHLELVNRNHADSTSIFHNNVVESTSFIVCTQLARFCHFTSGIAPTLHDSSTKNRDVKFLIDSYSRSCDNIFKIVSILTNSNINSEEFVLVKNTNPLTLLISSLIGLSCIKKLGFPNFKSYSYSIESMAFKFVFLILTLNIFTTFELENVESNHEEGASNDDIQSLFDLYVMLCSDSNNLKFDIKKSLYYTWLYGVLPFCRQAAILFYQLFDFKPHLSLTLIKSLSPPQLINHLLNYLRIPACFGTLLHSNEIEILKNYATKAACFNLSIKHDVIPYCKNYYAERISLVDLPSTYLELIIEIRKILCPKCKIRCKSAFKCLICGQFIVKNYACSCFPKKTIQNIFDNHLCKCDISQGIFLRVKRPFLYYSSWNKNIKLNFPIYEDSNGEPSQRLT
ncbi:hypothetical protein MXB_926 [Myxobolus squamalis]|nr:hypothetical protein MXB_926 [Myxobolus squamalis]